MTKRVVIIGGGYTGLAAAFDIVSDGHQVTILEQSSEIGGLAGVFELTPGRRIEKFYHHWFTSDTAILGLIDELGLSDQLSHNETNTGLYYANSVFRLASPLDLLKFKPIPLIDRIRTGLMALYARRINDWKPLEHLSTEEWVIRYGGRKAYEVMWKPLLAGKFGEEARNISAVWFWNKLKLRGSSRNEKGGEELVYFKGGFGAVTDALARALTDRGVELRTNTPATEILVENGRVKGVATTSGVVTADAVLATAPLPNYLEMAPFIDQESRRRWSQIRFLGNVCLVLRLKRSLSSTYWLNVADPEFPFVGVIEHTNMDDRANYGGEHIAYLSKYLPTTDAMFRMSDDEVVDYALPYLNRIFPEFSREWLYGAKVWRASYSQPIICKEYSTLIPPTKQSVEGLWLSTMAQIYPEDRGTNYAVRHGRMVAKELLSGIS